MAPAHPLTLRSLTLVALGGGIGTLARYLLSTIIPDWAAIPVGIFLINVIGAGLLGLLVGFLSRGSEFSTRAQDFRLLLGTGFLGGFTTYSALAMDTVLLLPESPGRAAAYALVSVALGVAAAIAGLAIGKRGKAAS